MMSKATSLSAAESRNETEERLLDVSLTLFASKGFAATSVREIIEAVGVTRPVLYYYCDSKQDLFERVIRWKHEDAYRELTQMLTEIEGAANRLRAMIRGTFAFCAADPRVPQLMFQMAFGPVNSNVSEFLASMADKRFRLVAGVIQEGLTANELQGGSAASLALLFCSIMDYHASTLSRMPNPKERLTPELADSLVDAFLHGVSPGKRKTPQLPDAI